MHHRAIASTLCKPQRNLLVRHVDGIDFVEVPYARETRHVRDVLIQKRLIRWLPQRAMTKITDDGRMVLAMILADAAETLLLAGYAEMFADRDSFEAAADGFREMGTSPRVDFCPFPTAPGSATNESYPKQRASGAGGGAKSGPSPAARSDEFVA